MITCFLKVQPVYPALLEHAPSKAGKLTTTHCIFQELSDFFRTWETLKVAKKEMWVQARQISTTLLAISPTNGISPELLQDAGFDPKKALVIVLPGVESTSGTEDSRLDSDQESAKAGGPQAATAWYIQLHLKAVETGQASRMQCPSICIHWTEAAQQWKLYKFCTLLSFLPANSLISGPGM